MIRRVLEPALHRLATLYPVVTVTGPRQSGKTTLCKAAFPDRPYVSLERIDQRDRVREDPLGFLAQHQGGAVIDEAQNVPELFSYLQVEVDRDQSPGRFILTGSQHFGLSERISQSLAGRAGVLHLLPASLDEVQSFAAPPGDLLSALWSGGYPRIFDRGIPPDQWLSDYVTTYVQRDVRQLLNVSDLEQFTTFVKLCAGRTAQVLNLSALGADAGVSHTTARAWLSVLETSFLVFRLPPLLANTRKRLVRTPKLHFVDSGLVCNLLGIRAPEQLREHPLRGSVFESWVASEVYKWRIHRSLRPDLHHVRDRHGLEVDLALERALELVLVESKSGATVARDLFAPLARAAATLSTPSRPATQRLVYGGDEAYRYGDVEVIPWQAVAGTDWGD
jgi:uncharacterized protein